MNQRLLSLDAFRGFTIAAMLLVNNPGDWGHVYGPLEHARWDGWTFTDWIFPFFVFISGISMTISLERRTVKGEQRLELLVQTFRRGALIICIGLLLNFIPALNLEHIRIPGVLQRLGLCTMLVAPLLLYCQWRQQLGWLILLMVAYTLIETFVPVPDALGVWHTGSLQPGEDTGAWLDRTLMGGHLWRVSKTWDPEGLLSTLPAIASQLAGVLAGHWLTAPKEPVEKTSWLMVVGLVLIWLGQVLGAWSMPVNKSLWSPSYTLMMAGWACLVLGLFYWFIDAVPHSAVRTWSITVARPLVILGMNALFIFALSGLVAKMLGFITVSPNMSIKSWLFALLQGLALDTINTSLLFAVLFTCAMWGIAWVMWRKAWFIKV